jgi:two-component system, chemotaxis family, sensor kinase CheA
MDEFDEIVREFLVESYENLDQLDRDLVDLEREPDSRELLQSIFRTIHTIKGTSGFLAFGRLEALTHAGEGLLAKLRDGGLTLTHERTSGLLDLVDAVRGILAAIEATGAENDLDHGDLVARLTALQEQMATGQEVGQEAGVTPIPAREPADPADPAAPADPADPAAPAAPADPDLTDATDLADDLDGTPDADSATDAATDAVTDPAMQKSAKRAKGKGAKRGEKADKDGSRKDSTAKEQPIPLLGEFLKTQGVDETDVEVAILEQRLGDDRPLGEILVEHGQATDEQIREALAAQAGVRGTPAGSHAVTESTLRVDVNLLDTLMRLVGELVLTRNQIVATAATQADSAMLRAAQRLNLLVSELQEGVMKTRMQPIDTLWNKLPRMVRDLGVSCGREVRLELEGRETELDKTILEAIKDPLTHLVRNAIDHGIEAPEIRRAAGKPAEGRLLLRAFHEGGQVNIEIIDDGAGIDPERVAAKALRGGVVTPDQLRSMADREIVNLIFVPGFTTVDEVTNVSGRGVGMDVVRTNIEKIGGTVDVTSELGTGTAIRLKIPLTLAIIPALTVQCAGERYAVPQVSLEELVCIEPDQADALIEYMHGAAVYRLRGNLLPLVWLDHVLEVEHDHPYQAVYILVLQAEGRRFGLVVDRVLNTEEIVVKPLSRQLKGIGTYAGATILGDGRVSLIVDVRALARRARVFRENDTTSDAAKQTTVAVAADGPEPLLVVAVGDRRVGVPLSMVTRLEEIPAASVERVGQREVVQYRGQLLPLGRLSTLLGTGSGTDDDGQLKVIVYTQGRRSVGLVVDGVVDIADETPTSREDVSDYGVAGVAVVQERVTELLDMEQAIIAADPRFFDAVAAAGAADVSGFDSYAEMGH